jgi:FkbM family methyltransferase
MLRHVGSNRAELREMVRAFAKAALVDIVSRLPAGARQAVLERWAAHDDAYGLFQAVGRHYGIRDIRVTGEYGLIEGSIDDDAILATYARSKRWAETSNTVFERYFALHRTGTYIDIGANIGLTTIPVARNPRVACKAFEPEPGNFGYLRGNIERNCRHGNVELFNLALFNVATNLSFELSERNRGDHRIRLANGDGEFGEGDRAVISVRAERLDDVLDATALARPIAVKIDTQGAESQVFAGGRAILGAAELIAFEFWPYGLARIGGDTGFFIEFLKQNYSAAAMLLSSEGDEPLSWQPIAAVAATLKEQSERGRSSPYGTYDVLARK